MVDLNEYMWTGLVLGTAGAIRREVWPIIWIIMEVNMISFLWLLTINKRLKKSSLVYFIIQRVGSLSLLAGRIVAEISGVMHKLVVLGLVLKIGLAPLHNWAPTLVVKMRIWFSYIFLTWQKVAPLFLMMTTTPKSILVWLVVINSAVAALIRIGSKELRLVLFYSGLIHFRWLSSGPYARSAIYFIFYRIVSIPVFLKINIPLSIANIAGVPPITGFFMKLSIFPFLNLGVIIILLATTSLLLLAYFRVFLSYPLSPLKFVTLLSCFLGVLY